MRDTTVSIYRRAEGQGARFNGLVTCGSGWTCPVCCTKIAEVKRRELSAGLVWHVKSGGRAHLMTLTAPHTLELPLAEIEHKFQRARTRLKNSRTFKRVMLAATRRGTVGSMEHTFSQLNGWHPHLHEIVFVARSITPAESYQLRLAWVASLLREGLGSNEQRGHMIEHALDLRGGEDAADYITKYGREETWGITSELTRQHAKDARGDHHTPFGLLQLASEGHAWAAARFKEYAEVTKGRRLMTWSPGLRKALALGEELTDEQLADAPIPDESFCAKLTAEQWTVVMQRDARAELLDYVCEMCVIPETAQHDVDGWVEWIRTRRRGTHGGDFNMMMQPAYA